MFSDDSSFKLRGVRSYCFFNKEERLTQNSHLPILCMIHELPCSILYNLYWVLFHNLLCCLYSSLLALFESSIHRFKLTCIVIICIVGDLCLSTVPITKAQTNKHYVDLSLSILASLKCLQSLTRIIISLGNNFFQLKFIWHKIYSTKILSHILFK